jgi:hypothetical protein
LSKAVCVVGNSPLAVERILEIERQLEPPTDWNDRVIPS